jgi:hypothetical protein
VPPEANATVGTAGDGWLGDFSRVVDALSRAIEMQQVARAINMR